ncbi:ArnT family glycosyltransferase [Aquihabitans daechungensis]|uniref:ArnT family glycosyltransferase n=1 Tax=Aquihabitans daechungensis TaxID=1052257 RepID=UPI003BA18D55
MTAEVQPAPRRILPPARTAVLLGLLVLVGFVIRIDALRNHAPEVPVLGDARAYHLLAENLADGRGYIRPYEFADGGAEIKTAEYPPGLPVLLAVATKAGASSETSQRVLLCGIGALTVGLVGLIGRRLGGDGVGYLAALVAAVHPGLWNADVSLMAEPLASFMGAALILAALATVDRPDRLRWALFGVVAGLGCFVRSEFLLMGPALMAAVAWRTTDAWRQRLGRFALGVGVLVLVLVPWTIRNLVAFDGELVPLSNNSGSVARGANCDAAYAGQFKGLWVTNVALDGNDADDARAGCFAGFDLTDDNEAEAAAELRSEGMAYLSDHKGRVPAVMAARLGRTFGLYQFTQQRNFAAAEGRNPMWDGRGTRGFQVLALVGVVGLVISSVRRTRTWERWLLVVPPAAVVVIVAFTYGNPRFRAAAEPAVVVLAALGAFDVLEAIRSTTRSVPADDS